MNAPKIESWIKWQYIICLCYYQFMNNFQIVSGGSTGADTGGILASEQLKIPLIGYVMETMDTNIKNKYSFYKESKTHTQKDKSNVNMSDLLIAFRLNRPLTGKGTDMTINYARYGKYNFVPLTSPKDEYIQMYDGNDILDIYSQDCSKLEEHKSVPVIIIWSDEKGELTYQDKQIDVVKNFIKKYNAKKIMISGPTRQTYDCEHIICKFLMDVLSD